ncbi:MAG TPA: DNA topoisomerase IB [Blastocatellia bacterium]|nr:DNA topoisomerase IB [Blastocatellia bacterium]
MQNQETPAVVAAAKEAARAAGLRYVSDAGPGIRRRRTGKGFSYLGADGKPVRDSETLSRIRSLAIPPAWTQVWICPLTNGHLQATGRDTRGRKQYRYHARWRAVRDETKYDRMIAFGQALPRIRERTERDLALPGLPREKVLAAVVRLLEVTLIRVGNDEYARTNHSFGLTTLRDHHVRISGDRMRFQFRGKSGVRHAIDLNDRRLARIVRRCQELPGQELFQYLDDEGNVQDVGSADVNDYLREITGEDFTARDFRTWAGTVLAAMALQEFRDFDSQAEAKRNIVRAIESVAKRLGNTPAVCRKCYVHPAILDLYSDGALTEALEERVTRELRDQLPHLQPEEAAVLALLQQRLERESSRQKAA